MHSDYALLADACRVVDNAGHILNSVTREDNGGKEPRYRRLVQAANTRGIRLSIMPKGMARHNRNSTQVKSAPKSRVAQCGLQGTQMIFWHLDVHFVGDNIGVTQQVKVECCAEDTVVEYIVKGALSTLQKRTKRRKLNTHRSERDVWSIYESSSFEDLIVFLQNEYSISTLPGTSDVSSRGDSGMNRYTELDRNDSLMTSLKGKCIIEFPVLFVAKKESGAAENLRKAQLGVFEKPDAQDDSSSGSDEFETENEEDNTGNTGGIKQPSALTSE